MKFFFQNKVEKLTVIRSPHIDKKSREQFQSVTHQRSINLVIDNYKVESFLNMCKELHKNWGTNENITFL